MNPPKHFSRRPTAAPNGFRLKRLALLLRRVFAVIALGTQFPAGVEAAAPAPGVRIPFNALPSGTTNSSVGTVGGRTLFAPGIVSGTFAPAYQVNPDTLTGTITQTSNSAILQWNTFDIGAGATVNVVQPSSSAVLLNRVNSGAYAQSILIEGALNANGQVYLYNPNGIIFGKTSQVNVNSLVATTLQISNSQFLAGILAPTNSAVFATDPAITLPGTVAVEGDSGSQAHMTTSNGGRIFLIGRAVTNDGILSSPDGQVILAAGGQVFVTSPTDLRMRGLVVEVANTNIAAADQGAATNDPIGQIMVNRGNATMVGMAVNQMGLVSATTSVSENGSIFLHARDGSSITAPNTATSTIGGALVLGAGSVTEILPDVADTTTSTGSSFTPSWVDLMGKTVHLQGNALVKAPAGEVDVSAFANAGLGSVVSPGGGSHIYLDSGATIDVSGTVDTLLPMESNVIQVQLRGNELADSPLLRGTYLQGQTVSIDIRQGTPLANVQGWLNLVEYGIGQQSATGGTIKLQSDSDIVVSSGATLNVSGGAVTYLPGYILTSQLTSNGSVFDIGSATPDRIYDGILTPTAGPRNFNPGYVQGYNAGSVTINSPSVVLRGDFLGNVINGPLQRTVGASGTATGGLFVLGNPTTNGDLSQLHFAASASLNGSVTASTALPAFDDSNAANPLTLPAQLLNNADLAVSRLAQSGFSQIRVYADEGSVNVAKPIALAAGGELTVSASGPVEISGNISSPGGKVAISSQSSVTVDDQVNINVAGQWTNDLASTNPARDAQGNPTAQVVLQGGSISLTAAASSSLAQVTLGNDVALDVSGGAWMSAQGKLTAGSGGSIVVGPVVSGGNDPAFLGLHLGVGDSFKGYGVSSGGKLQLSAPNVLLGAPSADPAWLGLDAGLFQVGGFTSYDIRAGGNLTVANGATIAPRADSWVSNRNTANVASGQMADAFGIATLPLGGPSGARPAASLSLRAASETQDGQGVVTVGTGAVLETDPLGTVTLSAGTLVDVEGRISAPGGTINLYLTPSMSGGVAYLPDRAVWLGSGAVLDASGSAALLWNNTQGITQGNLLDGGQVNIGQLNSGSLLSAPGYVVATAGSQINVAGTTAVETLGFGRHGIQTATQASSGGSINIQAREGLLLDGSLSGAGGNASASGGSLSLMLDRDNLNPAAYPTSPLDFVVARQEPNPALAGHGVIPPGASPGQSLDSVSGQGFVLAGAIDAGGFDSVHLKSANQIAFDLAGASLALSAGSSLVVDAPNIGAQNVGATGSVSLNAPYVELGNTDWRYQGATQAALGGNATLVVNAQTADIIGQTSLQSFGKAQFNVAGDVRLLGQVDFDLTVQPALSPPVVSAPGSLTVAGNIEFDAAQVYPTSFSNFTLTAQGNGNSVVFNSNGGAAPIPLSAAGSLKVVADNIVQNGVVRAPLGSIEFAANSQLTYTSGSLTSVANSAVVPLGFVQNGTDWFYDFGNGHTIDLSNTSASNYVALPEKSIISRGASVVLATGAKLDLSGGGDLYAYEFTPGPGGSKDVLAQANTYAILPGFQGTVAPSDFQNGQTGLAVGEQIFLSGIPGLVAGYYTLLPAHYALLPGAFAISAMAGTNRMSAAQNSEFALGNWQVAGYLRALGGGSDHAWQGFLLTPSAIVREESQFTDYTGNAFLASSAVNLPQDGGHVVFDVTASLALNGLVNLAAAPGGQRGMADISAPEIAILSDASQALPAESSNQAVVLVAPELSALGADSLLIGGVRSDGAAGETITVGAGRIVVANDAAHGLTAPDVILVAGSTESVDPVTQAVTPVAGPAGEGSILLKSGASVTAAGQLTHAVLPITLVNKGDAAGVGADGALLRVSSGGSVGINRNALRADGSIASPAQQAGTLTLETGVTVAASGAITLDATQTSNFASMPAVGAGAALQIGAPAISLGSAAPVQANVLRFDNTALASLSQLSSLFLTSYSSIDLYGTLSLGGGNLKVLDLAAGTYQAHSSPGDIAALSAANTLTLQGGSAVPGAPVANPNGGTLLLGAQNIDIGSGNLAIKGFSQTTLNATADILSTGASSALAVDGNLTLASSRIVAAGGSALGVTAGGTLNLLQGAAPAPNAPLAGLAGSLSFAANQINSNATVLAPSGQVSLAAADGIAITGGTISAAGTATAYGSTMVYSPGGQITLDGGAGNVVVGPAATLDVSSTGAAAGSLSVKAVNGGTGMVQLDGTLKGSAAAGLDGTLPTQGSFALDVDVLDPSSSFGALNATLNGAGFTASRDFRVRNGDVMLAAADLITAHQVQISADDGNVTLRGTIDARGSEGGSISVYAAEPTVGGGKGNLLVDSSAKLLASATVVATSAAGSQGRGGSIVLGTSTGDGSAPTAVSGDASLAINSGANLDVSGQGLGSGGTVLLRAPRLASNNDVAISALDATTISGASSAAIEAFKVYTATTISANPDSATNLQVATSTGAPAGRAYTDAQFFASNDNLPGRLAAAAGMAVLPGIEVRSPGDLLVSVNESSATKANRGWNLDTWRFNGQPGVLTLRAAGNLNIDGSISDGFVKTSSAAMPDWSIDNSGVASWSYRLVGGADLTAALPTATVASATTGDVAVQFARTQDAAGTDHPVALVRTGTGFIDIAAGRDVVLDTLDLTTGQILSNDFSSVNFASDTLLGATVYTAGAPVAVTLPAAAPKDANNAAYGSTTSTSAQFTQGGGDISMIAQRDVIGAVTEQLIDNWLFRQGRALSNGSAFANATVGRRNTGPLQYTAWWSRFDYFDQGIATFGGGDINIVAQTGNVDNLSASTATNGYVATIGGNAVEHGGGDLTVSAGGDIRGGAFYVQKGTATLSAVGALGAGDNKVVDPSLGTTPIAINPVLAAGDTQFVVTAGKGLALEGVFNPTLVPESSNNATGVKSASFNPNSSNIIDQFSYFSTYSTQSSVRLTSLSGNVFLSENAHAMAAAGGNDLAWNQSDDFTRLYLVSPASMDVAALGGDIDFAHGFSLWPSPTGELEMLANGSVKAILPTNVSGSLSGISQPIVMIDRSPSSLFSAAVPQIPIDTDFKTIEASIDATGITYHTAGGLHSGDTEPVRIIALNGSIDFSADNLYAATLVLPKKAEIIAGQDILNAGFTIQQLAATDVTTITAGRDILDSTTPGETNVVAHVIDGPGRVDMTAGRNFDLGNGNGVETRGNLDNPYLPQTGAGIDIVAGAMPNYASFTSQYTSVDALSASEKVALVQFMAPLDPALGANASAADAWTALNQLSPAVQRPFWDTVFFSALRQVSGADGTEPLNLAQFDATIASLFPAGSIHGGNVNVFGSQLKTSRGGAISIFAPGGSVYAGLVSTPAYLKTKSASDLGIFSIAGGAIQALVANDFLVNQGRVFTLGGGDITLVSQFGNIDAGKGAKTAQAAPPPVLTTDNNGNTQVDISGSISGSGIATLRTGPDVPASDVYPIAPRGTFDAGDAGVRSTGSVTIVAQTVLNASNISAAGTVSGTHSAETSGMSGAVAAPSSPPPAKNDSLTNSLQDPSANTSLSVELVGYGETPAGGERGQAPVTQDSQTALASGQDDRSTKRKPN